MKHEPLIETLSSQVHCVCMEIYRKICYRCSILIQRASVVIHEIFFELSCRKN